jgi:hypothetical protein
MLAGMQSSAALAAASITHGVTESGTRAASASAGHALAKAGGGFETSDRSIATKRNEPWECPFIGKGIGPVIKTRNGPLASAYPDRGTPEGPEPSFRACRA